MVTDHKILSQSTSQMDLVKNAYDLKDFFELSPPRRQEILLGAIQESHTWHFERNRSYRRTVEARGVGSQFDVEQLPRLLRPTAQTFKAYIEILGTPFPQYQPRAFLEWLADQLSIQLPRERFDRFRSRYPSLEALLVEIEAVYADFGL